MKLEAIREDRTRGGRSTYQCSYTLSPQSLADTRLHEIVTLLPSSNDSQPNSHESPITVFRPKREPEIDHEMSTCDNSSEPLIPQLIQDILSVEHLWHNADKEHPENNRNGEDSTDIDLCNIADHRLYKIVKWCKSLPLFREIQVTLFN
jgi:nuclear receptor subfamily 5 group A member 3